MEFRILGALEVREGRRRRAEVDRAAAVPLFNERVLTFVSERVGNHQFHLQWGMLLDQLWVR
jgi:hypothetical protein